MPGEWLHADVRRMFMPVAIATRQRVKDVRKMPPWQDCRYLTLFSNWTTLRAAFGAALGPGYIHRLI